MKRKLIRFEEDHLSKFEKHTLSNLSTIEGGSSAGSFTAGNVTLSKDDQDKNTKDSDSDVTEEEAN